MELTIYKLIYTYRNLLQFLVAIGCIYLSFVMEAAAPGVLGVVWAFAIIVHRFTDVLKQ